tara:strand:- start:4133 stop:4630 length:498 start_codon:yes stop_codon:yes gene_type:complete
MKEKIADGQDSAASYADYAQSLQFARSFLPTLISQQHLDWLATWDYALGYVPAKYFNLFSELSSQMARAQEGVKDSHLRHWLNEGNRLQLSQCLPAAAPIFDAVKSFAHAVVADTVSRRMPDGELIYEHGHAQEGAVARITNNWQTQAEDILAAYRAVVDGASQN